MKGKKKHKGLEMIYVSSPCLSFPSVVCNMYWDYRRFAPLVAMIGGGHARAVYAM